MAMSRSRNRIEFRYNLRQYWNLLKKYKYLALLIASLSVILQLRFLIEKFLFKFIVDNGTEFAKGALLRSDFIDVLLLIGGIFILISALAPMFVWSREHFLVNLTTKMMQDLKRKYFNHIVGLHHDFHTTHKTGSLISRLLRGGWTVDRLNDTLVYRVSPLVINIIIVTASIFYFDWISAVIAIFVALSFITYGFFFQRFQESANLRAIEAEDFEKANTSDFMTNIDSIKYYGKEKSIDRRYEKIITDTKKAHINHWYYFRWYGTVLILIQSVGFLLVLYSSVLRFLNNEITLGSLAFIYTAYAGLMEPMWRFNDGVREFYRSMADFQDLFQYGKIHNKIKDTPNAKSLKIKKGAIEFRNVGFNYGRRKLFRNFNLKIKPNEKVALVGHSGCGKTTLVKLLNRFYDVDDGRILIDGKDIKDVKQESLRSETGIVPQECILFDDTIYNNIRFARPGATRKEVLRAMRFAQLDKIVRDFPKKENTIVGERGVRLSGGEKQRVSIARAILANKKILVLDEATSSLDSETEHEIQKDLRRLLEGRTSIIIAHRLSTIMSADRIIVLKNGKIVQQGSHSELIQQKGEYRKLWNLQKGGYIN
ncbi:ATP-binding cassette domain-containing protein [Candidatus Pacearchaeota archaeon]|nr:ATP-binding cassette domain-containing protein [Candidatus Pacearchaeota archaeon]MBD3283048.1 ATP-binding cassette domain-containing protein [Candidatus Pacearchaeota archaeon]